MRRALGQQKFLRAVARGWLLSVLFWLGLYMVCATPALASAPNALAPLQQSQGDLEAGYVTEVLRGLKHSLPKYSQLSCQPKDFRSPRSLPVVRESETLHCAMTVLPAPQLRTLVYKAKPDDRFSRLGEAHQYMVEISDTDSPGDPEPLEVMIEEPPQVRFGELPPICEREQDTIVCRLNREARSADGMFRIRLPLQIEQEPPEGHLLNVSIPAWLLVDNCGSGECRPDDRRPVVSTLSEVHVTSMKSQGWLYWGLLVGAGVSVGVLLAHHFHSMRRLGNACITRLGQRRR